MNGKNDIKAHKKMSSRLAKADREMKAIRKLTIELDGLGKQVIEKIKQKKRADSKISQQSGRNCGHEKPEE